MIARYKPEPIQATVLGDDGKVEIPGRRAKNTVNVLGTEYKVIREVFKDKDIDGYCDYTSREIRIRNDNVNEVGDFDELLRKQLRHEIIHAFLAESGLQANYEHYRQFGHDETLVDWMAIQFPKIYKAFLDADAL